MKIGILLQARCASKRLPNKILKKINKFTMLELVIDRLRNIDDTKIIVVTTKTKKDNKIINICKKLKLDFYRGSTNNVLSRFYQAATFFNLDIIIRCNADCPLIDRKLLKKMLIKFKKKNYDYLSNILEPSYPSGLHIEIFNYKSLKIANENASTKSDKEHVTPYIYNNPKKFNLFSVKSKKNLSYHRWTVDYKHDLKFIRKIFKNFYKKKYFGMNEIINFLKYNPELKKINYHIEKKQNLLSK